MSPLLSGFMSAPSLSRIGLRGCIVLVGMIILAGCGNDAAEAPWAAYQAQLANDLDAPAVETSAPGNIGAFPQPFSPIGWSAWVGGIGWGPMEQASSHR